MDYLRNSPNESKRLPLEQLKSTVCTDPDVRLAQKACVDAFEHHVRSVELQMSVKSSLDAQPSPSPAEQDALRGRLLEANLEVEEGKQAMPSCESLIASLRIKHKI